MGFQKTFEFSEQKISDAVLSEYRRNPLLSDAFVEISGYYKQALGHKCERGNFGSYLLIYCIKGKGILRTKTFSKEIGPGELFFCLPHAAHFYQADKIDPWTIYWVHCNGNKIAQLITMLQVTPYTPVISVGIDTSLIDAIASIVTLSTETPDISRMLYISSILLTLLTRLQFLRTQRQDNNNGCIDRSIEFIKQNFQQTLTLAQLAKQANMSVSNYSFRFKQKSGISPIDYLIRFRLQKAQFLLRETSLPLKKISLMLGYKDEFYFSRLFNKLNGTYPSVFRKNQSVGR